MKKHIRITRISPASLAFVCGVMYFLAGVVVGLFGILGSLVSSSVTISGPFSFTATGLSVVVFSLIAPLIYAVLGALTGFLIAWVYNFVVKATKGVLLEISESDRREF